MRFPTAHWPEVRSAIAAQIRSVPGAARQALGAVILLALGALAAVSIPVILGRVVDQVLTAQQQSTGTGASTVLEALLGLSLSLAVAVTVSGVASAVGFYLLARITERIIANMREEMVGTALGLPVHRIEDAGTGDLISRSTDDVATLSAAVTQTVPVVANSGFTIVATGLAIVTLDWQYLAVIVLSAPIFIIGLRQYLAVAPGRYAAERAAMADRADRVLEAIHGRETVRAYRLEAAMHDRIDQSSYEVVTKSYRARHSMLVLQMWKSAMELVMVLVGLAVAYYLVTSGSSTVGSATAAVLMLIRLRGPLMGVIHVLDTVQSGYASLARIVGVTIDPPAVVPPSGAPPAQGHVELSGVSYRYEGAQSSDFAVKDVTIDAEPGQFIALVGASGAGKTTVAALAMGLRVPTEGSVTIDGVDVATLADNERGERLAMVSQEVHVFSGTLREDLSLAAPDASDAQLEQALERVGADWVAELPDGLDTEVGSRGLQLDPVAAQQLALARILLLDPKVVVMDEAAAEAGSAGAGALEEAAMEVTRGRTALVVAHRLDQAKVADRIVVMDSGEIIESGTHEQLLAAGGHYATMWAAWQQGREELPGSAARS